MEHVPTVTVIGTGAIGTAVALRLLTAGVEVVVWNRTPVRAAPLVKAGAVPAETMETAVAAGDLVLLALSDAAAVAACLDRITTGLAGRTVVTLVTSSPDDARAASARIAALGGHHLQAGVQSGPEAIGTGTALIHCGGPPEVFERARTALALLGPPRLVGGTAEAAAVWDLALFGIWYDAQLGLLRALHTARAAGVDVPAFAEAAAGQLGHVVAAATATAGELLSGEHPAGPASLADHLPVVRRLADLRAGHPLGDGGLSRAAQVIDTLIAAGRGAEGLTATTDTGRR
jgi:3-hydroxyisobutyrate dehydrogenase-like beta-hydroxyacid dehydrogenase